MIRQVFDPDAIAALPLACVHCEYPNKIAHAMRGDADIGPPRALTPAFYGCFDWHSAVHGHWTLVRIARLFPDAKSTPLARAALAKSLTDANLQGELAYAERPDRAGFERPYGLAWLLMLGLELTEWRHDAEAQRWSAALEPLVTLAARRLADGFGTLSRPVRTGEHSQTAFAMALALDWARGCASADAALATRSGAFELEQVVARRARELHLGDVDARMDDEPSGYDFLSPRLGVADLVRRVTAPDDFAVWLGAYLPRLPVDAAGDWLRPVLPTDRTDGKVVHLDGLNLSRAWMLEGIASALPRDDPRALGLQSVATIHAEAGLASLTNDSYGATHWLGTFAAYLVTRRGISR